MTPSLSPWLKSLLELLKTYDAGPEELTQTFISGRELHSTSLVSGSNRLLCFRNILYFIINSCEYEKALMEWGAQNWDPNTLVGQV